MPKRHQRKTQRSRTKGYKLKLNPQLAHLRTVKGWQTKHHRYHYGLREQVHHVDLPQDENLNERDLEELRQQRIDAIEDSHAVPEKLLRKAASELARAESEGRDDPKMREFIAKARAAREREKRAKIAEVDPGGTSAYSRTAVSPHEHYGEILKPIYVQINPNPGPKRSKRQPYIIGQNAKRAVDRGFNVVDPVTGRGTDFISESEKFDLVAEIQKSHVAPTANERQVAANNARTMANRLAQKAQREIDRRGMQTEAMSIEAQAREAAGLPASTPFGGPPESHITGTQIEGEVAARQSGSRKKTKKTDDGEYDAYVRHYTTEAGPIRPVGTAYANPRYLDTLHTGVTKLGKEVERLENKKRTPGEDQLLGDLRKEHTKQRARYDVQSKEYYRRVAEGKHIQMPDAVKNIPREQRLGGTLEPITVEDTYKYWGHEDREPERGSVAHAKGKLRAQYEFNKAQKKRLLRSLRSGDLVHGWGDDRRTVSDMNEALFSLSPNKKWKYRLNRSPSELERNEDLSPVHWKELDYWDTETRFHRGTRDKYGNLLPGEWDEVHEEHLTPKFDKTVNVTLGKREAKLSKEEENDTRAGKDVFVPISGITKRSTKRIQGQETVDALRQKNVREGKDPTEGIDSGRWTQRLVQITGRDGVPRWYPASQADWELRRKSGQAESGLNAPSGAARTDQERYQKDVRVHYVPEHEMRLSKKERDRLSIKLPSIKIGNRELLGGRLATIGLDESTDRHKALNHLAFGYTRAADRINRDVESRQVAANESARLGDAANTLLKDPARFEQLAKDHAEKQGITEDEAKHEMESRLKSLAAAGALAAGYTAKRAFIKGHGPKWVNDRIDDIRASNPGLDRYLKKHNAKFLAVEDAFVRPAGEKVANLSYRLQHPLSDPSGQTMGVDWGRWRYRDFWINEDTRLERVLERHKNRINRVERTQEWLEKNAYSDSPWKRFIANRREPLKRTKDYSEFLKDGGLLDEAQGIAEKVRDERPDRHLGKKANDLLAEIEHVRKRGGQTEFALKRQAEWAAKHAVEGSAEERGVALAAPLGKHFEHSSSTAPVGARFAHLPEAKLGEMQNILARDSIGTNIARWAGNNRGFLIGAGVVGLAVGAHYARHKWVESRKPESERIAYYNKILPPAFTVRLPHIRATGYVNWANNGLTRELGVAGKRFPIPVKYGISLKEHRIALRPMDRGYPANAPIIGGIRFRGPAPGGSLYHSVLENPEATYNRKRSFTPKYKQVHVLGKALPVFAQIGDRKKLELSRTNPNRLTQADRESLVWAYKDTPEEESVKNFYRTGRTDEKLLDMFDDEKEVTRIRKKKGDLDRRRFEEELQRMRRGQRAESVPLDDSPEMMQERREDAAFRRGMGADGLEVGVSAQRGDQAFKGKTKRWEEQGVHWR